MKNNDLEKYISELSPELQEKARQCKDMDELNKLIAENDVELSDDALEAVAGGCSCTNLYPTGTRMMDSRCLECGDYLYYFDQTSQGSRYFCSNPFCIAYQEQWLFGYRSNLLTRVK